MGLTKTETWICDLFCLAYLFVLNSAVFWQQLEISQILVSQKLFERKLVAHFLIDN